MQKPVSLSFMLAGILFTACLLISNILAVKIIMIGPWAAPAGVLIFPVAYILNDVIAEVWGYRKARLIIWFGFAMNALAVIFYSIAIALPKADFWTQQQAFSDILGSTPRLTLAGFIAYLAGSFLNAYVLSRMKIKSKGKNFGVRAILSTLVGESADSFLFITISFAGIFASMDLIKMIITQALLKTVYEIIILPVTIIVVRTIKKIEEIDTFDNQISYSPFRIRDL